MKNPARILISAMILPALLGSCGTMNLVRNAKDKTVTGMSALAKLSVETIRPTRVQVVEVREKDLRELPSGQERALAFESKKRRGFWFFNGPVDFKEPALPTAGGGLDEGLLPPIE